MPSHREDLKNWLSRTKSLVDEAEFKFLCELKIDDLTVNLTYKNGVFI